MSNLHYKKKKGTSGARGQLYESKLLSLILFRLLHDEQIEEFYLGTNVHELEDYDDICVRFKMKSFDKPIAVCIQAKHKEDLNRKFALNSIDLLKYFDSAMKIIDKFNAKDKGDDAFFKGDEDVELVFVYYTNLTDNIYCKHYEENIFMKKVDTIIGTDNESFQLPYKIIMGEIIKKLGAVVANIVRNKGDDYETMMGEKLLSTYHVILAQKVFDITDEQQEGTEKRENVEKYRIGRFKSEFFATNDEHLVILRGGLLKEIKQHVLEKAEFKLPHVFGNNDMTLKVSTSRQERRLTHLSKTIVNLLKGSKETVVNSETCNIVNIDENFSDKGFLETDGGIAGAVGNLLILDEKTKLLMFAKGDDLKGHAKTLFEKINSLELEKDLEKYRFDVNVQGFPKLSFECKLIADFASKLLFYTNQASENKVEVIVTNKIRDRISKEQFNLNDKSDSIFKIFHHNVQNWWLKQEGIEYLTEATDLFQNAVVITPLRKANVLSKYKWQMKNIKFDAKVINKLQFDKSHSTMTIIDSELVALSVNKLTTYFSDSEYFLIDLNYILSLSTNDREQLKDDIKKVPDAIFILASQVLKLNELNVKEILRTFEGKILIVVTNNDSVKEISNNSAHSIIDSKPEKICLADFTKESQDFICAENNIIFQGEKVSLNVLFDGDDPNLHKIIKVEQINKIINGENILIGKPLLDSRYEKIKDFYVSRKVRKVQTAGPPIHAETLYDVDDLTVVIAAEPGTGKSTLLTHLSLATKALDPGVWIVRIDLLDYSSYYYQCQENKVAIDVLEALRFILRVCNVIQNDDDKIKLYKENDQIHLSDCKNLSESVQFEICMFLHLFNRRKVILLFDGFDEICPDYKDEVMKLLKVLNGPRLCRMWVTSRTNNDVIDSLKEEFGKFYKFEPWILGGLQMFFEPLLRSKLNFSELTLEQIDKIDDFMQTMFHPLTIRSNYFATHTVRMRPLSQRELIQRCESFLRSEFGSSELTPEQANKIKEFILSYYSPEPFCNETIQMHFSKESNIILSRSLNLELNFCELTPEQTNKIIEFMITEYTKQFTVMPTRPMSIVYYFAALYFKNEIRRVSKKINGEEMYTKVWEFCIAFMTRSVNESEQIKIPLLLLHIAAEDFQSEIKHGETKTQWDRNEFNTMSMFERFVKRKFEEQYKEKNKWDLHTPHNMQLFKKEFRAFLDKHQRLAAYVTFLPKKQLVGVFNEAELKEIKDTITSIKQGEYNSFLIDKVVNDFPRFIHKTFAEYLTLEYMNNIRVVGRYDDDMYLLTCYFREFGVEKLIPLKHIRAKSGKPPSIVYFG